MKKDRTEIVPREALESMSTAVLQEILDNELEVESPADVNVALIKEITTILIARTGESEIDVDAKYDENRSEYLGYEMLYPADEVGSEETASETPLRRKKGIGRVLLVAAALVVLFVATAQASGVNLLKAFSRWTEETFEYDVAADVPANEGDERFAELKDILAKKGVTIPLVPRYLPDGYKFEMLETGNGEYRAIYEKESQALIIQIHPTTNGNASRIEKNEGDPDIYIVNGIEHHIVSNLEVNLVTWVNEGYECTISGIPSIEDTYKMIDSIYWED